MAFSLASAPVAHIRLDTGNKPGITRLYQIEIFSTIQNRRIMSHEEIFKGFKAGSPDVQLTLHEDYVAIHASSNDPYIYSTEEFVERPWLLIVGVPFIFALLAYSSLRNADLERLKKNICSYQKAAFSWHEL